MAEMYVQGVSTRKGKAITEALCGHEFSAYTISRMNESLDEEWARFARRRLQEAYPYLTLDGHYEKVREDGVIRSLAVLVAIGINEDGRRCVLAVELAQRKARAAGKSSMHNCGNGPRGVELVISDDHAGLRKAHCRELAGSGLATLLCALSEERHGLLAAESR